MIEAKFKEIGLVVSVEKRFKYYSAIKCKSYRINTNHWIRKQ